MNQIYLYVIAMFKTTLFIFLILCCSAMLNAQDLSDARKMVDTLTSPYFWGRGYTRQGMEKAGKFLANEFKAYGLQPMAGNSFFQAFTYRVNTFPGAMEIKVNGQPLEAGKDFIVSAESKGSKGQGLLVKKDSITYIDVENKVSLILKEKLTWSVARTESSDLVILADQKAFSAEPSSIEFNVENLALNFEAFNICGMVKGTEQPDSVILISAHYDHLGGMGKDLYFPGANDNASGISLLLGLAKYYAAHPPAYSIVFIAFAGEEAGLLGSEYFTDHPLIPLKNIRFLVNVDMVGTGNEGITVVNATQYLKEFAIIIQINNENKYLQKINSRGKAANSDHYWFTEKGVPAFFIYTLGGIKAYHDVFDRSKTLPLDEYEDLFKLIRSFNARLME